MKNFKKIVKYLSAALVAVIFIYAIFAFGIPRLSVAGKTSPYKIHVAVGFHVNLYHSYRIDTNDEAGFGKDIRIIRKIIRELDSANAKGIPVKAVWDSENLFSLQESLPKYAPDIIKDIQRRVKNNGDEIILMSYNNAIASALTPEEFSDSVKKSITNPEKSGVVDLFGKYSPYVRPQEMMFTPGSFRHYEKLGIKGVVLYYSGVTFDSFRVFEKELSLEEAHNPLNYRNRETGETGIIIPAYNQGDLAENVSISRWVSMLRREQLRGNIKNDVLLFINADADDEYWFGYKLPAYLSWLPNTGGLKQLIESLSSIDYVKFTTIDEYMKNHKPVGEVSFGQDTADGSFNGYVSWSEKSYSHRNWTAIAADRRIHDEIRNIYAKLGRPVPPQLQELLDRSYETRTRLLSTTNFGMATPFLAGGRERVVEALIEEMKSYTDNAGEIAESDAVNFIKQNGNAEVTINGAEHIDSVMILQVSGTKEISSAQFLTLNVKIPGIRGTEFFISDGKKDLKQMEIISWEKLSDGIFSVKCMLPENIKIRDDVYHIYAKKGKAEIPAAEKILQNEFITINFSDEGHVKKISANGRKFLDAESLLPKVNYNGKWHVPGKLNLTSHNGTADIISSVEVTGDFILPVKNSRKGKVNYRYSLAKGTPAVFIDGDIVFPDTPRKDLFNPSNPSLSRLYDEKWIEAAPVELVMSDNAAKDFPYKVIKRNYLGVDSSYLIDYFRHSSKNLDLANVNNHITPEYVAVAGKNAGIAVAMDTTVLANFAFSPLKIEHGFSAGFNARLNPFGTYFGDQYYQPTWGHGDGFRIAGYSGAQYKTSAGTYNGAHLKFSLMVSPFKGRELPDKLKKDMIAFANPLHVISINKYTPVKTAKSPENPDGFLAAPGNGGVYFHWEKPENIPKEYRIYCSADTKPGKINYISRGSESAFFAKELPDGTEFETGKTYYAYISAVDSNGKETEKTESVKFTFIEAAPKKGLQVPISLQLRILFHTLMSYLEY